MSFVKNPKLWSNVALVASILCVAAMIYCVLGARADSLSFREASGYLRTIVQFSLLVLAFCGLVAILSLKNTASLVKAILAAVIVLTPLLIIKANMPAGTAVFASAPARPPASAGGGMASGGGMDGGGMGGAPQDPSSAPINDISTDTKNPPAFSAVIPLRPENSNPIDYADSQAAAQAVQFPDIKPIISSLSSDAAFQRALALANQFGWEIVAQDANRGVIEAVASTTFFNFQDDVIIRVTANGASSVIDIRSHSRIGRGDRGKNAERVRAFIDKF